MKKFTLLSFLCVGSYALAFAQYEGKVETPAPLSSGSSSGSNTSNCCGTANVNSTFYNDPSCSRIIRNDGDGLVKVAPNKEANQLDKDNISFRHSIDNQWISIPQGAYNKLLSNASRAFVDKDYNKCLALCDEILLASRDSPDAYFLKGGSNYALGRTEIGKKFMAIAVQKGSIDAEETLKMWDK